MSRTSISTLSGNTWQALKSTALRLSSSAKIPCSESLKVETTPCESLTRKPVKSTRLPPPTLLDSISPAHSTELAKDSSVALTCQSSVVSARYRRLGSTTRSLLPWRRKLITRVLPMRPRSKPTGLEPRPATRPST